MVDETRRKILKTGATAAAMAAVPPVLAQQAGQTAPAGKFYERGPVRIHYQEWGSGFPLMLISGGGLGGSRIQGLTNPFDAVGEFRNEYRCIGYDLRTSTGLSNGPLDVDRPWEMMAEDQIGLMDHLGIDKFMVMGFCIGGPLIWNLLKHAPNRVVAAVLAQPSGCREENPLLLFDTNMQGWGPEYIKRHPDVTMAQIERFLTNMYKKPADFVWSVTRDFVKQCRTPVLILPDDIPAHPYKVAMEAAMLAPNAEVSMFPWKEPKERIPLAIRQIRSFLRAHRVAAATA
jgi:pimeloyl-ACP methyl ester carboxylesterase